MSVSTFFVTWSPTGTYPPRMRHNDEQEALRVAEDMARKHPGQEFFVLRTVAVAKKIDVTVERTTETRACDAACEWTGVR